MVGAGQMNSEPGMGYQSTWDHEPQEQRADKPFVSNMSKAERDAVLERLLRDYHRDNPDTQYDYERDMGMEAA